MTTPAELRDQLIRDLRGARQQLMSPEWLSKIREAPQAERQAAADVLMKTQLALLDLENEALTKFRDELIVNQIDIVNSTKSMNSAFDRLKSTTAVLNAVTDFLGVVARVVTLF